MKKILFVEPPPTLDWTVDSNISKAGRRHPCLNETGEQTYSYQNLSSAAVLRHSGYDVRYFHCPTERLDLARTKAGIDDFQPDALVIMVEHINLSVAEAVTRHARAAGCTTIWVGPFVTALHQDEIKKPSVDYILRHEWDYSVGELLAALDKRADLHEIKGLTWIDSAGNVVVNQPADRIDDLDALPIPAYDLVDLRLFYESVFIQFPAATMITSRGCPFNCVYCSYPQTIYSHAYKAMSPDRVVREMRHLVEKHGVKEIRIDDDTFNINTRRAVDICKGIVDAGLHRRMCFSVQARAALMTDELASWLKKANCRMVLYGVEAGNDAILKKIRKSTTKDEIRRGVRIAKKHGIDVLNCVMLGFYWDTPETVEETMNFAFELNAEFTQMSAPTPLPGTEYYELLKQNDCFVSHDWEDHDSVHHSAVNLPWLRNEDLNRYLGEFYRRYYRRPRYLWMMFLRMFRSWGNFTQSLRKFNVLFTK
jgi:radical SAM superfamily enzyme YgiQ (UPF0313 family)